MKTAGVVTPSKFMTLGQIESLRADNYVGHTSEYSQEEMESLRWQKYQRLADRIEKETHKRIPNAPAAFDCWLPGFEESNQELNKMAITMMDEVTETGPISKEISQLIDYAEVQSKIGLEVQIAVGEATQKAIDRMDRMTTDVMTRVKAELSGLQQQKTRVLSVVVNGERRKLSQPANPHLGRMLVNAKLGLNTLLVGPAGSGKTIAGHQVAESLGLSFEHVCLTAGASETWLFGRQTPNGFIEGGFSRAYREGGVFLADEMDAGDPNLLLAINTALANGSLYNPISGDKIARHANFVFIGAANTVGKGADATYTGRNRLDGATLNRFIVLMADYCAEIEEQVCPDKALREILQTARAKLRELKSEEIISTRTLQQAFLQLEAGISTADIFTSITAGWAPEMIEQCGLNVMSKDEELKAALKVERERNKELKKKSGGKSEDPFTF